MMNTKSRDLRCMPGKYIAVIKSAACIILITGLFSFFQSEAASPNENEWTWTVDNIFKHVPPLKNDATGRLPMICCPPFVRDAKDTSYNKGEPLSADIYRELVRRGLTQHIKMDEKYIPIASALQAAGAKVVIIEGAMGNGPGGCEKEFLHKLSDDYKMNKTKKAFDLTERVYPCLTLTDGWQKYADRLRTTLNKFKEAGVKVDGVWLDLEVEPTSWGIDRMFQSQNCSRCREVLPENARNGFKSWFAYVRYVHKLRAELLSKYVAEPVLEVFPDCVVTNWESLYSTPELMTLDSFAVDRYRPMDIGKLNATMPAVYGCNIYYSMHCKYPWDRLGFNPLARMDMVYAHVMLGQISQNAENAQKAEPDKKCIAWVARYCPCLKDDLVPILSRERYREILRHVWLRGSDTTLMYNPVHAKHPEIAIEELQDAVSIYDEMLEFRRFTEKGWIMNTEVPAKYDTGVIWSGMRLENEAVVRAFTQGGKTLRFTICPWNDGNRLTLDAPPQGVTYHISKKGHDLTATVISK